MPTAKTKKNLKVLMVAAEAAPVAQAVPAAAAVPAATPVPAAAPAAAAQAGTPSANEILSGNTGNFEYEISQRPDFALVSLKLQQGQKVFAEPL